MTSDVSRVKDIVARYPVAKEVMGMVKEIKSRLIGLCLRGEITEGDLYKVSSLLTPQSRSLLWEKYYIEKHGAERVSSRENSGDFILNGRNYEYKSSCNDEGSLHLIQVRLWQECDYIIQSIRPDEGEVITFRLTRDQMRREMDLLKATSAHGSKEANVGNKRVELRASVIHGSDDWHRWIEEYGV